MSRHSVRTERRLILEGRGQIFVQLMKPPANRGFEGIVAHSTNEEIKSGSADILWKIYLKHFIDCIEKGLQPKKAIMYVNNMVHLCDVHEFLMDKLGHLEIVRNKNKCHWVINSTCAGRRLKYRNIDKAKI